MLLSGPLMQVCPPNILINPLRMREGYSSHFMQVLCVCVSDNLLMGERVTSAAALAYKFSTWYVAIAGVRGYSYCNASGILHYSALLSYVIIIL